jgi:hypothetical protein
MLETKKQSGEPRDYKERFEFVLTTGGNIICQRYFRINNFNPKSLNSYELTSAIRHCASVIDNDLRDKTAIYLELFAPKSFASVEEMERFVSDESNRKRFSIGEGLVVRGNKETDYVYSSEGKVKPLGFKFDDGEVTENEVESNKTTYRFAFKVDGREACVVEWDGYYPKFVRDKIDLANKRGKFDESEVGRLSFEQYLLYKMVEGRGDLVYGLIKSICYACSYQNSADYTTEVDGIIADWNKDSGAAAFGSL